MPSTIAATNTAMKPLPTGDSRVTPYVPKATPSAYNDFWWVGIEYWSERLLSRGMSSEATQPQARP